MYGSIDKNAGTRALQEPTPIFLLGAVVQPWLIQHSQPFIGYNCRK